MQLSRNRKIFFQSLSAFPKSTENVQYFGRKYEPARLLVSETIDCNKRGYLND